jgi:hypothetical protein
MLRWLGTLSEWPNREIGRFTQDPNRFLIVVVTSAMAAMLCLSADASAGQDNARADVSAETSDSIAIIDVTNSRVIDAIQLAERSRPMAWPFPRTATLSTSVMEAQERLAKVTCWVVAGRLARHPQRRSFR